MGKWEEVAYKYRCSTPTAPRMWESQKVQNGVCLGCATAVSKEFWQGLEQRFK